MWTGSSASSTNSCQPPFHRCCALLPRIPHALSLRCHCAVTALSLRCAVSAPLLSSLATAAVALAEQRGRAAASIGDSLRTLGRRHADLRRELQRGRREAEGALEELSTAWREPLECALLRLCREREERHQHSAERRESNLRAELQASGDALAEVTPSASALLATRRPPSRPPARSASVYGYVRRAVPFVPLSGVSTAVRFQGARVRCRARGCGNRGTSVLRPRRAAAHTEARAYTCHTPAPREGHAQPALSRAAQRQAAAHQCWEKRNRHARGSGKGERVRPRSGVCLRRSRHRAAFALRCRRR